MKDASITASFEALSVPMKLATAGTAACFADFVSFPLDTAKVRLQVGPLLLLCSLHLHTKPVSYAMCKVTRHYLQRDQSSVLLMNANKQ